MVDVSRPATREVRTRERVAVVIVTFNRIEVLRRTLATLGESLNRAPEEIIVVDNASEDGTADALRTEFSHVHVVRLNINTGPAGGFAAGFREALSRGHDWIWAFNDDDQPARPDALTRLLAVAKSQRAAPIGMVGSWLVRTDSTGEPMQVVETGGFWLRPKAERTIARKSDPYDVDLMSFNGALISSRAVRAAGFPQSDFFMMMEEYDFCIRLREAGYRLLIVAEPLVQAMALGSAINPPWRGYYQTRNHLIMALRARSMSEFRRWIERTGKFVVADCLWKDKKLQRLYFRGLATWHAVTGRSGMTVAPR